MRIANWQVPIIDIAGCQLPIADFVLPALHLICDVSVSFETYLFLRLYILDGSVLLIGNRQLAIGNS